VDLSPVTHKIAPVIGHLPTLALLTFLVEDEHRFVPGICELSSQRLIKLGLDFAVRDILAALAGVPGLTVDPYAEMVVVWEMIDHGRGWSKPQAIGLARRLAASPASFCSEVARRIRARLSPDVAEAFTAAYKTSGGKARPSVPPRHVDPLGPALADLKRLEQSLRADFPGRSDLGASPSPADRALVVRTLAMGYTTADIGRALRGQAASAARKPLWSCEDTAESWVRLTWILSDVGRLRRALSERPAGETAGVVALDDGRRFAPAGEIVEARKTAPEPIVAREYRPDIAARLARLTGEAAPEHMPEET